MMTTLETMIRRPEAQPWPPPQGEWTYNDYMRLPDNGIRYEVIEGELYMSPAPRPRHQKVSLNLAIALDHFVRAHALGEVYESLIDVILPASATPVQPDVLFITAARLYIVTDDWIEGAPDLIVEVLSPTDPARDRRVKFQLYARAGVREYWIVEPDACTIEVYVLRGKAYAPLGPFNQNEPLQSEVLPGLSLSPSDVCPD